AKQPREALALDAGEQGLGAFGTRPAPDAPCRLEHRGEVEWSRLRRSKAVFRTPDRGTVARRRSLGLVPGPVADRTPTLWPVHTHWEEIFSPRGWLFRKTRANREYRKPACGTDGWRRPQGGRGPGQGPI